MRVFAVRDAKAGVFGTPFFQVNRAVAVRAVQQAAADPDTMLSKAPGDFALWDLGEWSDETGLFSGVPELVYQVVAPRPEDDRERVFPFNSNPKES